MLSHIESRTSSVLHHTDTASEADWDSLPSHLLPHQKGPAPSRFAHLTSFLRWHALSPLPRCESDQLMPASYIPPLFLQCFISGFADSCAFELTQTWVGFMTGNLVQLVINAFSLTVPDTSNAGITHDQDRRRLVSNVSALIGFTIGCQITANIIKRLSTDRTLRITIALLSLFRSLCTLIIILGGAWRPDFRIQGRLAWLVIALLASNLGCQASYSIFLNTPFSNTVVFTATLASMTSDTRLPMLRLTQANQLKALSIVGLLIGAASSQIFLKLAITPSSQDRHLAIQHVLIILLVLEALLGFLWMICGITSNWNAFQRRIKSLLQHQHQQDVPDRDT